LATALVLIALLAAPLALTLAQNKKGGQAATEKTAGKTASARVGTVAANGDGGTDPRKLEKAISLSGKTLKVKPGFALRREATNRFAVIELPSRKFIGRFLCSCPDLPPVGEDIEVRSCFARVSQSEASCQTEDCQACGLKQVIRPITRVKR
jgi:hypothetical protein